MKKTLIAGFITLISTPALAASNSHVQPEITAAPVKQSVQVLRVVNSPVVLDASLQSEKTTRRRVKRVVIAPSQTSLARDASTSDNSRFVYNSIDTAKSKMIRPVAVQSRSIPNLYKK